MEPIMSNASYLFATEAIHSAARRRVDETRQSGLWQRLLRAWREYLRLRREAAAIESLTELEDHVLRDIGADDELLARAAARRERREHPFAPASLRGIDSASRRVNW